MADLLMSVVALGLMVLLWWRRHEDSIEIGKWRRLALNRCRYCRKAHENQNHEDLLAQIEGETNG